MKLRSMALLSRTAVAGLVLLSLGPVTAGAADSHGRATAPATAPQGVTLPIVRALLPALANAAYGGYTTAVYVQNIGTLPASLQVKYLDTSGNPVGVGDQAVVQPNGIWTVRQDNGNSFLSGAAGSGEVLSDQPVATFVNEFAPGNVGDATSYTGIDSNTGTGPALYAPAIANGAYGGYTTGIGLINAGPSLTNLTINYRDGGGSLVKTQTLNSVAPGAYRAIYSGDAGLGLPAAFAGTATIQSSAGPVAAVVNETGPGGQFSSYDAVPAGSTTLFAPAALNSAYGGYNTGMGIQNTTGAAGTVTINYYDASGAATTSTVGIAANGYVGIYQGTDIPAPGAYTAKLTSTVPIAAIVNEVAPAGAGPDRQSTSYNTFASGGAIAYLPLLESAGPDGWSTGEGIMNTGSATTVTVTYYDIGTGLQLGTPQVKSLQPNAFWGLYQPAGGLPNGTRASAIVTTAAGGSVAIITNESNTATFMSYVGQSPDFFVHGQATDASTHAAVAGMLVTAVAATTGNLAVAQTDVAGSYALPVPVNMTVKIRFFRPPGPGQVPYLQQWWNNKTNFTTADPLTVNAETFNINAALTSGYFVHGQTTDATTHAPVAGYGVSAIAANHQFFDFAQTDAGGNYQLLVPKGSTVKIQFSRTPNSPPYVGQWWNNKPDFPSADPLTVNAETFNINAALATGYLVHGQTTDATTLAPVAGFAVSAVSANGFNNIDFAQTDAGGNYQLLVPKGSTVKIQFIRKPGSPYLGQWWNNKPDLPSADPLTVNAETFNINAALATGYLVHGQTTDATTLAPVAGFAVSAVSANGFNSFDFAQTDAGGNYQLLVPKGSTVKIQFSRTPNSPPYIGQWWNNKRDLPSADPLTVNAETFNINAALATGYLVHGQTTDATTLAPVAGMGVSAVDANTFNNFDFAQTGAGGNYQLLVPKGSTVKIQFNRTPSSPPYVQQWWNNKPDFPSANPLTVNAETFNINAALIAGYFVHGQATDATSHAPVAGMGVSAVDGSTPCCNNFDFTQTDAGGNYQVLVPKGSMVKIQFASFGPNRLPYFQQWWNNKADFGTADPLTVNAETFSINAALTRGTFIHGQVTDAATHAPVAFMGVQAVDATLPCCVDRADDQTDMNGNYSLLVPTSSTVKITFLPNGQPYIQQWWNNKPAFTTADPLTVNTETSNINAALTHT